MKKIGNDIINAEGSILALYVLDENLFLGSALNDGSGRIYYNVLQKDVWKLLVSEVTPIELFKLSKLFLFVSADGTQIIEHDGNKFLNFIQCGSELIGNLPDSMVSLELIHILF